MLKYYPPHIDESDCVFSEKEIIRLERLLTIERQRLQVAVEALQEIDKNTWNGDGNNRRAKNALKKIEEMK